METDEELIEDSEQEQQSPFALKPPLTNPASPPPRPPSALLNQRWSCPECLTTGVVQCEAVEDAAQVNDRIKQSHRNKSPHCTARARVGRRDPVRRDPVRRGETPRQSEAE